MHRGSADRQLVALPFPFLSLFFFACLDGTSLWQWLGGTAVASSCCGGIFRRKKNEQTRNDGRV